MIIVKVKVKIAEKERIRVPISTEFIRLDSALKLSCAVSTGGMAKFVIQDALVKVNGEECTQRGKKLRDGDSFEFEHTLYSIVKE